ncbi:S-(hydroxymethyl)mycothiol dehydrogenase [Corynebacterium liangguodongii]|uniref:S-(Hydroxymethyl)mycothiol dehydrogenase n=1 Tax=Corynebacterium liangguodongii TaxID=2079535 RepID=A0A2S0WBV1_9CORY|nr:S-(hydroxymethyl)mycothiol dehydrogenase [Corynebacterium liangguodongii]AWB83243.1 S-(hydroxymethyl)mycothiol dehydrogenase [Corynebacterium liangguodongii]PWC00667.1 S-(hydroxymethyl)mycothiol dehydrogenase [Corynebacterium liangguodongii]
MSEKVKGVIAREKGSEVELVDIVIPDPGPNDVVVKVLATGVCHTDLGYRDGDIADDFPFLLGHESTAIVETVGEAVTHVEVGDFVVLNWRAVCGECRACRKGDVKNCFNTHNASKKMTLEDGTELTAAIGIGSFAEKTLIHEKQCTKVDREEDPAAAALLGCGIMAGLGAAVNTGDIQRGESVAVFGLGGVGLAAIAGAHLAGASKVIAVDLDERKCKAAVERFGATDYVCSKDKGEEEVIEEIRNLTSGFGPDVTIDAVGIQPTWRQAFYSRDLAGRMVMVGVPNLKDHVDIPAIDLYGHGGSIKPAWYGDCLPERDFPTYVDLHMQGRFPLGEFVSERIGIEDIEEAFAKMKRGDVLRSVVEF